MPKSQQMLEGHSHASLLVQYDVSYSLEGLVTGDGDCRQRQGFLQAGVHGDESFLPPLQQKLRVFTQHGCVVPMNDGQEKVIVLPEIGLNSANDQGPVSVPDLLDDKSDGVGALLAQRSCQEIWTIVQFLGCRLDPLPRALRYGARSRAIVQDRRAGP